MTGRYYDPNNPETLEDFRIPDDDPRDRERELQWLMTEQRIREAQMRLLDSLLKPRRNAG